MANVLNEEHTDVYGLGLTNFSDLESSLRDVRFANFYESVLKRATQLASQAGLPAKAML